LTAIANSCSPACTVTLQEVTWNLGTLNPSQSGTVTFQATVDSTISSQVTKTNSAQILSAENDFNGTDNSATFNTTVYLPSISGLVVSDANSNHVQDAGEGGLAGATVSLYRDGPGSVAGARDASDPLVGTVTITSNGDWIFTSGLAQN